MSQRGRQVTKQPDVYTTLGFDRGPTGRDDPVASLDGLVGPPVMDDCFVGQDGDRAGGE